jgi:hypothetical protein
MSRYCRPGLDIGPVAWVALVLFGVIMVLGALYYAAIVGLIVGAILLLVKLGQFLARTRWDR